jgi:hypothetical protein
LEPAAVTAGRSKRNATLMIEPTRILEASFIGRFWFGDVRE